MVPKVFYVWLPVTQIVEHLGSIMMCGLVGGGMSPGMVCEVSNDSGISS